jgi:tetratricopeptide (TPR) repeat protein
MSDSSDLLSQADEARGRGQWRLAETLYRHYLAACPDAAVGWFGLGQALLGRSQAAGQGGQTHAAAAAKALMHATALLPGHPGYHLALGQALQAVGDWPAAVQAYLAASKLVPSDTACAQLLVQALATLGWWDDVSRVAEARLPSVDDPSALVSTLAKALQDGHPDGPAAAERAYDRALEQIPALGGAWLGRGRLRLKAGRLDEALADAQQAAQRTPQDIAPLTLLSAIWRAKGALDQAETCCRQALALDPQSLDARAQLATLLDGRKEHQQAEALFRQVLAEAPGRADVAYNLAGCLMAQDRPEEALPLYQTVVAALPNWPEGWTNLGVTLLALARAAEAEQAFSQALTLPGTGGSQAETRYNLAWAQLIQGKFRDGWKAYEARWDLSSFSSPQRPFSVPLWDGAAVPRGGIYLHAEQGFGDALQMMRLVPLVAQKARPVVVEVPPALVRLAQSLSGADQVVAANYARPAEMVVPCACHAPLMSLPLLLGLDLSDLPAAHPYLAPPKDAEVPEPLRAWAQTHQSALRVGLVWAGAASNKIDRFRSLAWDQLAPLWQVSGVAWASLQVGPRAPEGQGVLFPLLDGVGDMADSASRIALLDLVVGVDTGVMHLAGAMGQEGWMMIPFAPDYRWLETGQTTPWYQTLRLFRQTERGDWGGVLIRLAAALQQRANDKAAR